MLRASELYWAKEALSPERGSKPSAEFLEAKVAWDEAMDNLPMGSLGLYSIETLSQKGELI